MLIAILLLEGCVTSSDWDFGLSFGLGFFGLILLYILVPVLFIVLIAFLIRWIIKASKEPPPNKQSDDRYLEIAKERYAKGEITKEEFEQIKKDLS